MNSSEVPDYRVGLLGNLYTSDVMDKTKKMSRDTEQEISEAEREIKKICKDRGITISPYGKHFWLNGHGVSYVVHDLTSVRLEFLVPFDRTGRVEVDIDDAKPLYIGLTRMNQ